MDQGRSQDQDFIEYNKVEYGRDCLRTQDGFCFYSIYGRELYISDLFVRQESRHQGKGQEIARQIEEIAIAKDCEVITCHIDLNKTPEAQTRLVRIFNEFGLNILSANNNQIIMAKRLGE